MTHLTPDELYAIAIDHTTVDSAAAEHLALCPACRTEMGTLALLVREFAVAKRSQPTQAALQRYAALFTHVQQQESRLSAWWQSLRAVLTWDSRQQAALQGVRSGAAIAYRLLFATDEAEIEMMVEPDRYHFRVQAEIIGLNGATPTPALVQWLDDAGNICYECEADANGRFQCTGIARGVYRLAITPLDGTVIEIEGMEIG